MPARLSHDFYSLDTIELARRLLGKRLVHSLPDGRRLSGRILETEAYLGVEDPTAHSFGGRRTPRTEIMYGPAGHSYIYFIYGMHFCFNVVTMSHGTPEAVLVRALEPVAGLPANGPGRLCRALGLNREHNGIDLAAGRNLWIEEDEIFAGRNFTDIVEGPRIGVGDKYDAVHWPLRFGIKGHLHLSPPKFPNYLE